MALPNSLRWANTIAVIVGLQLTIASVVDFRIALNIDNLEQFGDESQFQSLQPSLAAQREILLAQRSGLQTAITGMRPWRLAVEALLAASGVIVFVMALRLRIASEGRPEIAHWLGRAAIGAAVFRAIDGAQGLVIARTVTASVVPVLAKSPPPAVQQSAEQAHLPIEDALAAVTGAASVVNVLLSLLVVAIFMGLATYFRSERLRDALVKEEPVG
ncbi:MAG: hypothetical protein QM817_12730 [Archangium sp.]